MTEVNDNTDDGSAVEWSPIPNSELNACQLDRFRDRKQDQRLSNPLEALGSNQVPGGTPMKYGQHPGHHESTTKPFLGVP